MALLKIVLLLFIGITVARKCKSPIELAVVVDASDSLSLKDVRYVKLFIKSIANFSRMAVFSSHVSVILAGYNVSVAIALNKIGADKFKFYETVDKVVKPLGGEWSVNRGLQMIKKQVFTEGNEMRSFLPQIVLVVTSGKPGNGNDIQHQIKNLNDIGAKVYIVSVGDVARRDKIMRMIRNESSKIVKVHLNNFRELTSFSFIIGEEICQTHYHDELAICKTKMDVGFIVDSSGSINNAGYLSIKTFMKAISVYLGFAPDALRVGAVLYSKEAKVWIQFKEIVELRKLFKKLWKMPHYRDMTRIDYGLVVANTQLFTRESGMRDDAIKIAILLTDGEQTTRGIKDLIPLREAADKLREREVAVFAVGIGKSVRKDQLLEITNASEYVKILSSFNDLKSVTRKVARDVCQLVNGMSV
ncbi:collagen alpha-6(VI) chain-like [Xenia sp. Carnegie-2017]|uniref:collagen alpha-6(VI) chain-like n=1 Tax=Xenia sp. Carnegie-2017 TaxID=2897299 RepID=UPI001F037AEC|nr:collagen alpha-6(VI) chain-like [Xenia sp. Carnegie-2017]